MTHIGEQVLYSRGSFARVVRWYSGWIRIPMGVWTYGLTGKETHVATDVIKPVEKFEVKPRETKP